MTGARLSAQGISFATTHTPHTHTHFLRRSVSTTTRGQFLIHKEKGCQGRFYQSSSLPLHTLRGMLEASDGASVCQSTADDGHPLCTFFEKERCRFYARMSKSNMRWTCDVEEALVDRCSLFTATKKGTDVGFALVWTCPKMVYVLRALRLQSLAVPSSSLSGIFLLGRFSSRERSHVGVVGWRTLRIV